tara:strand:- start:152 stop:442 length:291 start_codon:yes stop_codon:yes gene_type:complete
LHERRSDPSGGKLFLPVDLRERPSIISMLSRTHHNHVRDAEPLKSERHIEKLGLGAVYDETLYRSKETLPHPPQQQYSNHSYSNGKTPPDSSRPRA